MGSSPHKESELFMILIENSCDYKVRNLTFYAIAGTPRGSHFRRREIPGKVPITIPPATPEWHWQQLDNDSQPILIVYRRALGISGVTLHSYRYAWAERAKIAG